MLGHARHGVGWLEDGLRRSCPRPRDDRVTWSYDHADSPWHVAFTPGVRALDVVGRRRGAAARRPADAGRRRRGPRAKAAEQARRLFARLVTSERIAHDDAGGAVPAGRPPDPRGHGDRAATPRRTGFDAVWQADSRLVRDAIVPMAAFAAVTDRITIGSGVVDCWTRNPARLASTFSTLDDLAPGRVILGIGAWWDPLAAKVGIDRAPAADGRCARSSPSVRALLANETVTLRRRLRAPRRRRARLRVPGAPAEGRADLHRRHRHADDGAHRRDRRRRRAQLPRVARRTTARAMEHLQRRARPQAGRTRRRHRPAAARRVLASTTTATRALDMARLLVTQYLGQQPHIMKASGVPAVAARRDRRGAHVAGDPRAGGGGVEAGARRDRADDHRVGHRRRVPGPRSPSTSATAARARSSTRSATCGR